MMRNLRFLILLFLFPAVVYAQDVSGGSIEEIARSVVSIESIRGRTAFAGGTGTIVSPDGLIYTNRHVIDGGSDFEVFVLDQDLGDLPERRYRASLVYVSETLDFAVLQIDRDAAGRAIDPLNESLAYLPPKLETEVSVTDEIRVYGYPGIGEGYLIISSGEIVSVQNGRVEGERTPIWYRTDADISGGNSGGLAVNEAGEFVGMPTWAITDDQTARALGGILPIGAIERTLLANPIDFDIAPDLQDAATFQIANNSAVDICGAYISPTDAPDWGDNQLENGERVFAGDSFSWEIVAGAYDLLLLDCDGESIEDYRNITVNEETQFTFIPGESVVEAGDSGITADADMDAGVVQLANGASQTICYVNISPVTSNVWGVDRLGRTGVIEPDGSYSWELEPDVYDIRLRSCDLETLDIFYDVDVTEAGAVLVYP